MAIHLGIILSLVVLFCNCLSANYRYFSGESDTYPADSENIRAGPAPPKRSVSKIRKTGPPIDSSHGETRDVDSYFEPESTLPPLYVDEDSLFDYSLETVFEAFREDEFESYAEVYQEEEEDLEPCTEINMHCQVMTSGYNAPAAIDFGCNENVFSIWVSFLYWDASQSHMDIALKSPFTIRNDACGNSFRKGKNVEMDTSYQPGFSVGVSYTFPCFDHWDISAEYTRLHSRNSRAVFEPPEGFLYARWVQSNLISNNAVTCLHDSWDLDFNVLNVELGRRCYVGRRFIVRPYIGLAAALIDQKFKGEMDFLFPIPFTLHLIDKSSSWALGPRIGMDANWYLTRSFSIVGNIAGDILFTHYHINLNQFAINNSTIFLDSSDKVNTLRQELELYLGLSYEFLDCCYYFSLEAGYDFQVWWNQNMIRWFNDNSFISAPQGNLYLQGLRVTFKIAF